MSDLRTILILGVFVIAFITLASARSDDRPIEKSPSGFSMQVKVPEPSR